MSASLAGRLNVAQTLMPIRHYLLRPLRLFREYDRNYLKPDLIAGITVAVILLPQAIAFALIAELPPQVGLYTAVVGGIIGALWGSSNQMFTGPANAISLLVLSTLSGLFVSGSAEFIVAAGMLAVMAGIFQMGMGVARLGFLVNFVSHSVVVGFAAGAGVLIGVKQLNVFLGIESPGGGILTSLSFVAQNLSATHAPTAQIGVLTIVILLALRKMRPNLPAPLIGMVVASLAVFIFSLDQNGVSVIGQIPRNLPPFKGLPVFNLDLISRLSTGALAVGAIGLVQVTAIARSISTQTGQRLDSNQEFVGQGLANVASGFFSGYNCAGSFSITAVNYKAGARSPFAAIFASLFVLAAMLLLGSLTAFLPRAALASVLIITAYGMVDQAEIARIWRSGGEDRIIMLATLLGTLFLEIEFAVLMGILLSLALYILRTSTPRVHAVVPDDTFSHFYYQPEKDHCIQLGMIEILGDLYFGAVNHVEEFVLDHAARYPDQRFLLIRMHNVNNIDFSGVHMLENVVKIYRERGGDVFLVRANPRVVRMMASVGFDSHLGLDHFLQEDEMISYLFHRVLDPAICIYECPVRVFRECQNLPKRIDVGDIAVLAEVPREKITTVTSQQLWQTLHHSDNGVTPRVIDVREPREFRQGHIAEAESVPLCDILVEDTPQPQDRLIVLVCRSGRRSRRAAYALQRAGCQNVSVLEGGMLAWEAAGMLEAIDNY